MKPEAFLINNPDGFALYASSVTLKK